MTDRPRAPRRASASSQSPYAARLGRLRALVGESGASHLLVSNPKDVGYLTGFHGVDSYLILPAAASQRPVIISDFRYQEELEPVKPLADVFIRKGPMTDAVAEVAFSIGISRLATQAEHLTIDLRAAVAKHLGDNRLADTTGLVATLRVIKDDSEVALIVRAARVQEAALKAVLPKLKPGLTELEVAARIEFEMKSRGSSEPGFQTIVAAGATGALPHYRPQARTLAKGKSVLIDWGAVCGGYHTDMTRVFAFGKGGWPPKIAEIYRIVLDAQQMAAAALAPGKGTFAIDKIARDHITATGYGEFYGHGLGHGLGLDGHEDPRLTHMLVPSELRPGMVVTVEPGIYLPGIGGVRIEDDYLITDSGARKLTSMPKDMKWATL